MKRPVYIIKNITGSLVLKSFTTSFGGRRHPKVAKSNLKPREASHLHSYKTRHSHHCLL